jgi:hypothetical protein
LHHGIVFPKGPSAARLSPLAAWGIVTLKSNGHKQFDIVAPPRPKRKAAREERPFFAPEGNRGLFAEVKKLSFDAQYLAITGPPALNR